MQHKTIYFIELIILLFIIIFKLFLINTKYSNIINIFFWITILVILIILGGIPRDKNYLKKVTNKTIIIILIIYIILTYFIGLFTGFYKTSYSHEIKFIIQNVFPIGLLIFVMELVRYLLLRKNPNKIQIVLLTILYILLDIVLFSKSYIFESLESIFIFGSLYLLPNISNEMLYTYITYNVSIIPTLILRLSLELYVFILPILPNFSEYLVSIFGIILPYIIYIEISKIVKYKEKYNIYNKKYFSRFIFILLLLILSILVSLVSGIFKYQMIAIGSGSMNPIYYRGDAVIFKKVTSKEVKEGDILVFKNGNTYITHRVVNIINGNIFITKGDNNNEIDDFNTTSNEVVGIVKYVVKYIGYPTIWFNRK